MRFSIFLIAATIAISANASIVRKSEHTVSFDACVAGLKRTELDIASVKNKATGLTIDSNYSDDFFIQGDVVRMHNDLTDTLGFCCNFYRGVISSEEADEFLDIYSSMIEGYEDFLSTFVSKKSVIEKDKGSNSEVKSVIEFESRRVSELITCSFSKFPADKKSAAAALLDKFNRAEADAKSVFGIEIVPLQDL